MEKFSIVLKQNDLMALKRFANENESTNEAVQRLVSELLENIFLADNFKYSIKTNRLYKQEQEIMMTKKERLLFQYLIQRSIISNDCYTDIELIRNDVWKDKDATIYTIRNKIMSIRDKTSKELIRNKSGHGYRINLMTIF